MPIYMKYDGIEGQVTAPGYEKQVDLESCQFGVSRNIASGGHGGNREASAPSVSEIVCSKTQDAASTELFKASLFGEGKPCTISFCKTSTDGKTMQLYFSVVLTNTLVSSFSVSGHGGQGSDRPMESFSLNFTKIEWTYNASDDKNKAAKPTKASWNLAEGKI